MKNIQNKLALMGRSPGLSSAVPVRQAQGRLCGTHSGIREYIAASQIWIGYDFDFLGRPAHVAPRMIEYMEQIDLVEPRRMLE